MTGVDDDIDDGDLVTSVIMSIDDVNSDDAFDPLADQSVTVTTQDDDAAGLTIVDGGGVTVDESGTSDTFTVQLDSEPLTNVFLDLTSNDLGEATVSPATLTFTAATWDVPQVVTVTGVDDQALDGDVGSLVTVSVNDASSDDVYDPVPDEQIAVTTTDDDVAGLTIVEEGGSTIVTEAGGTDTYTVVLDAQPGSSVSIAVSSADTNEATVAPATLTFTTGNWDTPQTVTVTGVDDVIDDGDQVTVVSASVIDATSDDAYDGLVANVNATTTDDDNAGVTVSGIAGSTDRGRWSGDLHRRPRHRADRGRHDRPRVQRSGRGYRALASVVFTTLNWNTPQTVIVTGVDDDVDDGDIGYFVLTGTASSTDTAYDGIDPANVAVTNVDDDVAGVTVSPISGPPPKRAAPRPSPSSSTASRRRTSRSRSPPTTQTRVRWPRHRSPSRR